MCTRTTRPIYCTVTVQFSSIAVYVVVDVGIVDVVANRPAKCGTYICATRSPLSLCTVCVDCVNEFFRWRGKLVALSMTYLFLVYDDWNGGNFPVDCKWPKKKKNKTKSFSTGISNKRSQCKHMKLLPINHILFTPLTIFRIDSWNRIEI